MQNGVSSYVYEGKRQSKKCEEGRGEGRGRKKGGGEKMRRDSPDPGGSGLSHFEGGFSCPYPLLGEERGRDTGLGLLHLLFKH